MPLAHLSSQKRIQKGDLKEFETLFKCYYEPLCRYANSFLRDMDMAEELVQEFFYNYWKNRESITIQLSLKSYLYRSIRNSALRYLEHLAVRLRYANSVKASANETDTPTPTDELELAELNKVIEDTLNQLPDRCREIFTLSRFEGLKYHEIADALSISVKTVEANMAKALQLFRKNLQQYNRLAV
ncbi:MAG: RNA polymerase sigma-70 factor [Bacteroidales bacterium]|nr:RNA polymerase sigma-70 factor [Bacteroidales bacterium]MBN2748849.1 RNA polymerase sigma-70 factor [Bacteroidales bacterium]